MPRPHWSEGEQAGEDLVEQAITRLVFMEASASIEELTSQGPSPLISLSPHATEPQADTRT